MIRCLLRDLHLLENPVQFLRHLRCRLSQFLLVRRDELFPGTHNRNPPMAVTDFDATQFLRAILRPQVRLKKMATVRDRRYRDVTVNRWVPFECNGSRNSNLAL